jgi:hypothetical protein
MSGKKQDNSSFLKGATRGKPGKNLTKWQKKPEVHRALIRGAVFWPIVGITALAIWSGRAALLALVFSAPILSILAFRKGRLIFFSPFTTTDAENGVRTQHWILRNKWRRLVRMQPVPGLVTKKTRIDPELPIEMQEAIRADVANNELKGISPVFGKVQRYKRKSVGR